MQGSFINRDVADSVFTPVRYDSCVYIDIYIYIYASSYNHNKIGLLRLGLSVVW